MSIGGGESSESQIAQEIMKSWSFVEGFIADNDLAVEVYAAEGWSKGSNELQINQDAYDSEDNEWLIEDEFGVVGPPSSWQLFKAFSGKSCGLRRQKVWPCVCLHRVLFPSDCQAVAGFVYLSD